MADGSIVFDTRVDNTQAVKDLQKLNNRIKTLTQQIETKTALKLPIAEQAKEMAAALDAAKMKLESMKAAPVGAFTDEQIAAQVESVKALQAEWNKVQSRVDAYDAGIQKASAEMEVLKTKAGGIQATMATAGVETEKMAVATQRASRGAMSFARQMKFALSSILLYGTLFSIFSAFTEWVGKIIRANDQASAAIGRLKASLLTLAQPIINVVIPALTFLANVLSRVISVVASFVSMIFGTTLQESASSAESLYNQSNAIESVGTAAKKASKQLASFDEINKLAGETADSGGAGAGGGTDVIPPDFSEAGDLSWLETTLGKAAGWVTAALLIGGIALVAIGAATGRISLVLAGLLMLGSGVTVGMETGVFADWAAYLGLENAEQFVPLAIMIGGIALVALGAALGQIMMVIAGLGLIGAAVVVSMTGGTSGYWADKLGLDSVFDYVAAAIQLAGIALIAIGAAMANIAMVIAGGVILGVGVALDAIGEERLKAWWEVLQLTTIQQWVSVALLLVGIALVAVGAAMGNILMVLAGAGLIGFGTVVAVQNGNLQDWVTALGLEKVAAWVTTALMLLGMGLIVFGIATGNILMVLAGAGLLGAGIAVGATSGTFNTWIELITTGLKACWESIKSIWNTAIAPKLEAIATFFKDYVIDPVVTLFKGLYNAVVGILEGIVNGFIGIINAFISGINGVIGVINKIPGVELGYLNKLPTVSIPRLAQGAVIPPNKEFMAILGDQKSGTNIEAPLDTIVQAFRMALAENGGGQNEAYLVLNEQVLGKVVYRLNNKESRRVGVSLQGV